MKNTVSGNEARGFMKLIVDSDSDTVVGIHMIGPDCAEIMQVSSCSSTCLLLFFLQFNAQQRTFQAPAWSATLAAHRGMPGQPHR